jgi:hypothetical protein
MWPDGRYVVQKDEEVKSARPVPLVVGALNRPAPPNRWRSKR